MKSVRYHRWWTVLKYLFIETYCLGSHSLFVNGLSTYSSHNIDIVTLPGENWRWRMLGSALHIAENIPPLEKYDGIIVTDLFRLYALWKNPEPAVTRDEVVFVGKCYRPVWQYTRSARDRLRKTTGQRSAFREYSLQNSILLRYGLWWSNSSAIRMGRNLRSSGV